MGLKVPGNTVCEPVRVAVGVAVGVLVGLGAPSGVLVGVGVPVAVGVRVGVDVGPAITRTCGAELLVLKLAVPL